MSNWPNAELTERAAAQSHFIDLCRMLGEPSPTDVDPKGLIRLREGYDENNRRRRLGRRLEASAFRLRVQGQAEGPERRVRSAAAVCAGVGEPAAIRHVRHGPVSYPYELDQQRF